MSSEPETGKKMRQDEQQIWIKNNEKESTVKKGK